MAKQRNANPTKDEARKLAELYFAGLDVTARIRAAEREYVRALIESPNAAPVKVDEVYTELKEIRASLDALPDGTRANGATKEDVIGAIYGTKTKADCRRTCREAFGR